MKSLYDTNFSGVMIFLFPWKAYDISEQLQELTTKLSTSSQICLMALPFSYLQPLSQQIELPNLYLGADNMMSEETGAFTENLAAPILKKAGASFVMIGSAANRRLFNESDESINHKLHKAHNAQVVPLLCIGETFAQKQAGQSAEVLARQLEIGLQGLTPEQIARTIIVVEMPWLAKSEDPMTAEKLSSLYETYEQQIKQCVGEEIFHKTHVIYAFNDEVEDKAELVHISAKQGFYAPQCKMLLGMLDSIATSPLMATLTAGRPAQPVISEQVLPFEKLEPLSFEAETGSIKLAKQPEEVEAGVAAQEALREYEAAPTGVLPSGEAQPPEAPALEIGVRAEQGTEKPFVETAAGMTAEAPSAPGIAPEAAESAASSTATTGSPLAAPSESKAEEESISALAAQLADENIEEALQAAALPGAEEPATAEPEELSLQALNTKISQMAQCDKVLKECYEHMKQEADRLFVLRQQFPPLLTALAEDLNKLDPELQAHINKGDLGFFAQHPEKAQEAQTVLLGIQKTNTMVHEANNIPKHIDHFTEKGRQLREQLAGDWAFFTMKRKEIEQLFPNFALPALPSQLTISEPTFDVSAKPLPFGQSPLTHKNVGVVNLEESK